MRDFGLVHNDSDPERYCRLVSYELMGGLVVPIRREYRRLDVSNPKSLGFAGPEWRMVVVRVTELPTMPTDFTVKSWMYPEETETLRRMRIRHLRSVTHVHRGPAEQEPGWCPSNDAIR